MLIDLHADTPLWQRLVGYDFCRAHRAPLPAGMWAANLDLPRLQAVNMTAQVFGLVALPWEYDGFGSILQMVRRMQEAAQRRPDGFCLVRSVAQLKAALRQQRVAGLLSIEGVHTLRGDLRRADQLLALGVIGFGLAHFSANAACSPAYGLAADAAVGLRPFGVELVRHLAARRAIVDLAHINTRGYFEALQAAPQGNFWVSHTGVQGVYPHWRNLSDAQIKALAARGGVVGIIFSRHFLGGTSMEAVVAHILHVIRVGGLDAAALGSDFDGFIVPVRGLRDIKDLPALAASLGRAGLRAREVDAVMGGNAYRFLHQAL
jgi:membrane dipeptidase